MSRTRRLLLCGVVAGPLFVAVFTVAGAVRPDYLPLRHPVSSLALTGAGWTQSVNFLVTGTLLVLFAVGVRRLLRRSSRAGVKPWLLGTAGAGLLGAGLFPADPVSGYPPGTPDELVYTPAGALHDAASMLFFFGLPLACLAFALWFARARRWVLAAYSVLSAVLFLGLLILASIGFSQVPEFVELGGLYQRLTLAVGLAWTTVLALILPRTGGESLT